MTSRADTSAEEIALAKTLNDKYRRRAVLLTARELEPHHFFERTKLEFANINKYASRLGIWLPPQQRCTLNRADRAKIDIIVILLYIDEAWFGQR